MSHIARYVKAPDEVKRYAIDYTDWLGAGETVSSVVYTTDLTVSQQVILNSGTVASFLVGGGVDKTSHTIMVKITTSGSQVREDVISFTIRNP